MKARDRQVDQNRSQEDERRKSEVLDQQRQTQTIVGAPQRDPEAIEFMPFRQKVKREIGGDERCAGRPKPGTNPQPKPAQDRRDWSAMSCAFMRPFPSSGYRTNDIALCFEFKLA